MALFTGSGAPSHTLWTVWRHWTQPCTVSWLGSNTATTVCVHSVMTGLEYCRDSAPCCARSCAPCVLTTELLLRSWLWTLLCYAHFPLLCSLVYAFWCPCCVRPCAPCCARCCVLLVRWLPRSSMCLLMCSLCVHCFAPWCAHCCAVTSVMFLVSLLADVLAAVCSLCTTCRAVTFVLLVCSLLAGSNWLVPGEQGVVKAKVVTHSLTILLFRTTMPVPYVNNSSNKYKW
jgi:hypothetical protein